MEDNNPRKALYKSLITSSNPDIRDGIRRFSFNKFDNLLTTNHNFQKDLFLDMKDAGLATGDESHFIATYIAEPKKMGNVVVEETTPQRPVQAPTLLQPAQQGPSLTAVTGQQAVTPNPSITQPAPEPSMWQKVKSYGNDIAKSIERGWKQGKAIQTNQVINLANNHTWDIDFDSMAKANKEVKDVGSTATEQDFARNDGVWDNITDYAKMVLPVMAESITTLIRSGSEEVATGATTGAVTGSVVPGAGTLAGAATGATAGTAMAGYNMELYASIMDELEANGVDISDPEQLKAAFSDRAAMRPILEKANTRAAIIGAVDLVGGVAGEAASRALKTAKPLTKTGRALQKVAKTAGKLDEVATGAGGEAAAQYATTGTINRQEVALEALGETPIVGAISKLSGVGSKPPVEPPTQLGGINTVPAPDNAPEFDVESELQKVRQQLKEIDKSPNPTSPEVYIKLKARESALLEMQPELNGQTDSPNGPEGATSETTFVTVTPEELDAFKQGNVDQERANAIADDVAAIEKGELTLEAIEDPLYREMVALTLQTNETATTTTPSSEVLGETTEATGQTGGGVGTDVQAVDEQGPDQEVLTERVANQLSDVDATAKALEKIIPKNESFALAIGSLPVKGTINYKDIKQGDYAPSLERYVNSPEKIDKEIGSTYKIYEFLKSGGELPNNVILLDKNGEILDGNNRVKAQLALGIKDFKYAVADDKILEQSNYKTISEAYHKAKQDGSNPELVKAVEDLIGTPNETSPSPLPVATDAVGGTTADVGTEPVADESGGSEVEGVDIQAAQPIMVEIAREFLNIDRLVAKGFVTYVDSKTGKPCAKFGMRDNAFSRGQKWEIVKDLKGYATHEKGGVDLTIDGKGVRMGGPDSKLYAADGLLMPGEPIPPQKKQQLAQEERTKYLQYMDDPTYKKRLGAELFGDKFDNQPDQQKLVESEFAKRRNDIEKVPISEGDIGSDYGLYTDPYYAGRRKNPQGTIQITNKDAPYQDHPSQNEGTYRQVVAHELGHASHRGDVAGEYQRDSKFETLVDQYHNPDLEKLADLFNPNLGWAPKKEKQEIIDAASRAIGSERVQQILKKKDELEAEVAQKQKQYGDKYDPNIHGPFYPKEFLEVIDVPRYNHLQRNPTEIATRMIGIRRLAAEKFGYDFNTPFDIKKYKEQIRQYFKENKMIDEMSDLDGVLKLSDDQINEMMKYIAKNNRSNGEVYG